MTDAIKKAERIAFEMMRQRDPDFDNNQDPEMAPVCRNLHNAAKSYAALTAKPCEKQSKEHLARARAAISIVEALRNR
jgi:hypothetical protein